MWHPCRTSTMCRRDPPILATGLLYAELAERNSLKLLRQGRMVHPLMHLDPDAEHHSADAEQRFDSHFKQSRWFCPVCAIQLHGHRDPVGRSAFDSPQS